MIQKPRRWSHSKRNQADFQVIPFLFVPHDLPDETNNCLINPIYNNLLGNAYKFIGNLKVAIVLV